MLVDADHPTMDSTNEDMNDVMKDQKRGEIRQGLNDIDPNHELGGMGGIKAISSAFSLRLLNSMPALDYMAIAKENGRSVVVNQAGGYCYLDESDVITEKVEAENFPKNLD